MSDLIGREEALMALTGANLPTDRDKLIALFNERIKALPPVEQTEWISVKDRLPKEKGMYKITLQTDSGYRYVAEDYFFTERNFFESEAYYRGVGRKIIAWQPITEPSPYKGE